MADQHPAQSASHIYEIDVCPICKRRPDELDGGVCREDHEPTHWETIKVAPVAESLPLSRKDHRRVGCPVCGFVDTWPTSRDEKVWCAHTGRVLWGDGPHPDSPAAAVWTEMVPVEVVRA